MKVVLPRRPGNKQKKTEKAKKPGRVCHLGNGFSLHPQEALELAGPETWEPKFGVVPSPISHDTMYVVHAFPSTGGYLDNVHNGFWQPGNKV